MKNRRQKIEFIEQWFARVGAQLEVKDYRPFHHVSDAPPLTIKDFKKIVVAEIKRFNKKSPPPVKAPPEI